jgi:hypothetical protein
MSWVHPGLLVTKFSRLRATRDPAGTASNSSGKTVPHATPLRKTHRCIQRSQPYWKDRVVPIAQFWEKEFETSFGIELAEGGGYVLSSSQVLEKIVGYDAAAHPVASNVIWQILSVPRPRGLRLVEPHWRPGRLPASTQLPSRPVSLILQYKRPEFLYGARAKQWSLWHAPYFRFTRNAAQHQILRRLQTRLGSDALVRYVAPAFWTRADYEYRHVVRQTIAGSGFVSPRRLGSHRVWTYQQPGSDGIPNPRGRPLRFESFSDLAGRFYELRETSQALVPFDDPDLLRAHVERMGEAARYRNPAIRRKTDRWLAAARAIDIAVSDETLQQVADIAAFTTLTAQINAAWFVALSLPAQAGG